MLIAFLGLTVAVTCAFIYGVFIVVMEAIIVERVGK